MLSKMKNNIKADCLVLYHSSMIRWCFLIFMLICAYVLSVSSSMIFGEISDGFYTSQLLITMSQFNVFFIVILGAFLGAKDLEWQTYSVRLVNAKRMILSVSRCVLILIVSISSVVLNLVIGLIFDILGNCTEPISFRMLSKYLSVVLVVWFWGLLSYILAFLTKSFAVSSSVIIGYLFLESFIIRFLPDAVCGALPLWNQKSLLHYFFPVNEGAVAIVQQEFSNPLTALCVIAVYTAVTLMIVSIFARKKGYN